MLDVIFKRLNAGKPVLIAEIGVNYYDIARVRGMSLLDAAKLMVLEAANAGIHAVKFQSYRAETLAARESPSYWDLNENPVTSQRELFSHFDKFGAREYAALAAYAEEKGVEFLSTAFDEEAADYLEPLMNVYKISSSDLSNLPFIAYQARRGKPVLLSVGASNKDEIVRAVETISCGAPGDSRTGEGRSKGERRYSHPFAGAGKGEAEAAGRKRRASGRTAPNERKEGGDTVNAA